MRSLDTTVRIVIGGDVCPVRRNLAPFEAGDAPLIFRDLLDFLANADLAAVNLECPLIEQSRPISKSGPVMGATRLCINGLKNAGIDVAGLANNHILDHGPEGLLHTVRVCRDAGIATVGAGENLEQAGQPLLLDVKGLRVGIMAVAEHEFSIASRTGAGANPLNLIEYVRQIRRLKNKTDFRIVLLHGGTMFHPYPSPQLQQICRFMVEEGATAVICQHSHVPGCHETHGGGHIVYGQGNLVFDPARKTEEAWHNGFLVQLSVSPGRPCEFGIVPYVQSASEPGCRRMTGRREDDFTLEIRQRSARLNDAGFIEAEWRKFCRTRKYRCFSILRGHSRAVRALNRRFCFSDWFYSRAGLALLENTVRCESHLEVLRTVLSERESVSRCQVARD